MEFLQVAQRAVECVLVQHGLAQPAVGVAHGGAGVTGEVALRSVVVAVLQAIGSHHVAQPAQGVVALPSGLAQSSNQLLLLLTNRPCQMKNFQQQSDCLKDHETQQRNLSSSCLSI